MVKNAEEENKYQSESYVEGTNSFADDNHEREINIPVSNERPHIPRFRLNLAPLNENHGV